MGWRKPDLERFPPPWEAQDGPRWRSLNHGGVGRSAATPGGGEGTGDVYDNCVSLLERRADRVQRLTMLRVLRHEPSVSPRSFGCCVLRFGLAEWDPGPLAVGTRGTPWGWDL